jgi:predicted RNA binding protein with dsRBD fold (UPF0201 family)
MKAEGSVRIFPTEDPIRVRKSIDNIFPDSQINEEGDHFSFSTGDLSTFIQKLTEQRIRSSASMIIGRSVEESDSTFYLNKQAAFAGRINFTDGGSTLSHIRIRLIDGIDELLYAISKEE